MDKFTSKSLYMFGHPEYIATNDGRVLNPYGRQVGYLNKVNKHNAVYKVNLGNKLYNVAYVIAKAFIPNPDALPRVRHINGDMLDNRVSNLEWTPGYDRKVIDYVPFTKYKAKVRRSQYGIR